MDPPPKKNSRIPLLLRDPNKVPLRERIIRYPLSSATQNRVPSALAMPQVMFRELHLTSDDGRQSCPQEQEMTCAASRLLGGHWHGAWVFCTVFLPDPTGHQGRSRGTRENAVLGGTLEARTCSVPFVQGLISRCPYLLC